MWKGPGQDPGGGPAEGPPPGSSQELSDLKDQFEQQQVLIAQLKAMIRKDEQSNVTQEKVDEYMNTLSKRGGRAKKNKQDDKKTVDIPASQKISLLRQQVEENKLKLAERGKSHKGIEEMVTQLQAQLDDSQHLISHNVSLQDTKVEYSETSSSQELYMVLLSKEKRISDLLSKVQKLESSVLDLQENVKEKDSVIDARTKAITLMTENLSRKGKNTLDQLDETKEQMRKMQENFVFMETEMKARQMKLLDDLRQKNYEIAELEEVNGALEKQISELKPEEFANEEWQAENSRLQIRIKELQDKVTDLSQDAESDEISRLKKQLDESNKSMIKVKAQHKSKVKELTKKIDSFKKVSDANAEIVKLEAENGRLSQKIAELEEEKGSLQLKLVESDSAKGSEPTELKNELEEKIQDHERQLEEKDKVISILEAEISRSKTEIEALSEKLTTLSHLENAQVTSEMASIQFEEQMENENKKLTIENEKAAKEREELLETIEHLKKERQEISVKLEHYIQENMELIDKLEKLSAEKVSSAESIEIVEGLTQQEKLELEAYQKDMVVGNLKSSEENLPQVDLNESVNELTEETSELLQKIELFTVERREVMEKMEQLKQENLNLSLKIKEIENNRDVLAETYEQLQSEKEVLDAKLEAIESENVALKEKEEIENNKKLLEELENLNSFVQGLQSQLEERNKENSQLNNTIIELNRTLADLENDNKSLQMKITQLEEHKMSLNQLIDKNQEELEAINNTEWENRRLLESKDNEITKLTKERDNTESVILDLQRTIKEKDEKFHKISSDLKEKYLTLQKQLEENSGSLQNITGPLQAKIDEQTSKNKEQLEKMKKIAATLKKKTQAYQELEDKFKELQSRHDVELKTSLQQLQDLESEVSRLQQQFDDKCEEARVLEEKNVDLQNIITDLKVKADKSNEVSLQQELLLTRENLGSVESSLQAKIQELEMIVETQESELVKTRERVNKLEEGISFVEERRLSLERKANELGAELEEKAITCEEMSRSEDFLEKRLAALAAHDDVIEKKLEEAVSENQELNQQNQKVREKNEKLKKKLEELKEKILTMEGQQNAVEDLETHNENLRKQIHNLENELKTLQSDYEKILEENKNDFDKVNGDWQAQFDEILQERTELLVKCEKFEEELMEIAEKEIGFTNELIEYKTKLENSDVEIRNYEEQIQRLSKEREELDNLRQTLAEKEEMIRGYEETEEKMRQELDQLKQASKSHEEQIQALSTESEHLRTAIAQKEIEIENYRKQKAPNTLAAFFDDVPREDPHVKKLEEELAISRSRIEDLEKKQSAFDSEPNLKKLEEELSIARSRIEDLELKKSAQIAVDSVITEAQEHVTPQQNIPTFVWSGQINDPFDFIEPTKAHQETAPPPFENTQKELLDKIKTLEFMLYNVEKEKEDALIQCQQLTNELTQLIYEKQVPTEVESQILQESQIRDTPDTCKQLERIEFEDVRPPVVSSGPVVEEQVQAKEAYLCYADEKEEQLSKIECQVLSETQIADTPGVRQELQQIEYEKTKPPVSSIDKPVREEPHGTKEAYLCYTFGENDDGWGWGPDEAKLEEEHAQKSENLEGFKETIRVLEMERENHLEEIRQLQVKSGKLIKKLKEFKAKNEELAQRKKSESDLFNLDDTIQEELKLQIQQVEKKLKETSTELEKEKHEKIAILKRIDVLTAANERMVEMKEKQDIELLGWQHNYRELSAKMEQFEWGGDDGFSSTERPQESTSTPGVNQKIEELNDTIKELTLDNEELQTLLEEQRKLRLEAEKSTAPDEKKQIEELNNQLQLSGEEKKQLQDQVNELIKKNAELSDKFDAVKKQNRELAALNEIVAQLNEKLNYVEREKEELVTQLREKYTEEQMVAQLNEKLNYLEREKEELVTHLRQKEEQIVAQLNEKLTYVEREKEELVREKGEILREMQERNTEIEFLRGSVSTHVTTEEEKNQLLRELQEKNSQIDSLRASMDAQISQVTTAEEKNQLLRELQEKNSQIDSLRASMEAQISIEQEKETLFKELQEKNAQIDSLRESVEEQISSLKQELDNQLRTVQELLEEKKILSETITGKDTEIVRLSAAMEQMTQEWNMRIDQRGLDVAESWKLHLESRETEFAQIEELLKKEINELEEKCNALVNENNELRKNVDAEIRNEVDRVAALQQQINDRQQYINELTRSLQEKQEEVEILLLKLRTTEKYLSEEKEMVDVVFKLVQDETLQRNKDSLVKILNDKENAIDQLQQELQNKDSLPKLLNDKEKVIDQLQQELQNKDSLTKILNDKENEIVQLQQELEGIKTKLTNLQEDHSRKTQEVQSLGLLLEERNRALATLNLQIQEMQNLKDYEHENIENLQQNLLEYQQINAHLQTKSAQLENKEREIAMLRQALEEKEQEHAYATENLSQQYRASINEQSQEIESLKRRLTVNENHYEELLQSKDSDLDASNFELRNLKTTLEELSSQLQLKSEECANLQRKIDEQSLLNDEENKQLSELGSIIEDQVLKIEELKKELFDKSSDYDSLIAEMDISRTSVRSEGKIEETDDLTEPASRAELELAHYMLHQRDVRCEELTVELIQLLEERDTLQLRLSNAIREKEELGREMKKSDEEGQSSTGAVPKVKTEVATEAIDSLSTKLSELRNVGYRKDKTIVDEQELRRLQQFSIMHQHRDLAARLPQEAAARLVDASYTLSRDVQSPSKVLLNWLWGRSTPKVNNV